MRQPSCIPESRMGRGTRAVVRLISTLMPVLMLCAGTPICLAADYAWLAGYDSTQSITLRILPPDGHERAVVEPGSFASWLRGLPMKPGHPPVYSYRGRPIANQRGHWGVLDIDLGERDLQQCADAVIRLRAEYLYAKDRRDDIHFTFTNGDTARYARWVEGYRPVVRGSAVTWAKQAEGDTTYAGFRDFLDVVFTYAGTHSLAGEMEVVADSGDVRIGDVFVIPGSPGHAVMVVDMAVNIQTGMPLLLLAQGYMPAQDIHIVRNLADSSRDPWHEWNPRVKFPVLLWEFAAGDRRRFR